MHILPISWACASSGLERIVAMIDASVVSASSMTTSPKSAEKRFNDTLKRMLKTPPKPKIAVKKPVVTEKQRVAKPK